MLARSLGHHVIVLFAGECLNELLTEGGDEPVQHARIMGWQYLLQKDHVAGEVDLHWHREPGAYCSGDGLYCVVLHYVSEYF